MKVLYSKKCLKELASIPNPIRQKIEKFIFQELPSFKTIYDTDKIELLKAYKNYYKIRFGSYRIGLKMIEDTIIVQRVLHRKDIYKKFP